MYRTINQQFTSNPLLLFLMRFLFVLIFISGLTANAQKIRYRANTMQSDQPGIIQLVDNVVLEQNEVTILCDRAFFKDKENTFEGFGNIRIKQGTATIHGEQLSFDGNTKTGKLRNNIRLIDNNITLTTQFLDFNTVENSGYFYNGGKIIDSTATLTSKTGYYYSKTKTYFFKKDVVLKNEKYTLKTDSLRYLLPTSTAYVFGPTNITSDSTYIYMEDGWHNTRNKTTQINRKGFIRYKDQTIRAENLFYDKPNGSGKATKNVEITDSVKHIVLTGNLATFFDKPQRAMITDRALFMQCSSKDTLFLHADTLRSDYDSSGVYRVIKAFRKVQIFKPDMQARCDSLIYSFKDSIFHLYSKPVIWSDENQISAEKIDIHTVNQKANQLKLYNSAFIVSQEDTAKYNQISGRNMVGYIRDNQLYRIDILGNGKSIYYIR